MGRKSTGARTGRPMKKMSMMAVSKKVKQEYAQELLLKKKAKDLAARKERERRQQLEKKFRFNYRPEHNILLVGEANCSFARAIIRKFRKTIARKLRRRGISIPSEEDIARGVDPDLTGYIPASQDDMEDEDEDDMMDEDMEEDEDMEDEDAMEDEDIEDDDANGADEDENEDNENEDEDEDDDEDDEEEERRDFNFLFSNCGRNMIVSCYDSLGDAMKKYSDLPDILSELYSAGVRVIFDLDCSNMYKTLTENKLVPKAKFDRISFNFPHVGSGEQDMDAAVRENQQLLLAYLTNSLPLLRKATTEDSLLIIKDKKGGRWNRGGQVSITTKSGVPYDKWRIPVLARMLNHNQSAAQRMKEDAQQLHPGSLAARFPKLMLLKVTPFIHECFDGYAHRRTIGFKTGLTKGDNADIAGKEAKTYMFVRAPFGFIDKGLGISQEDNTNTVGEVIKKTRSGAKIGKRGKSGRQQKFKAKHVKMLKKQHKI